MIKNRIFVTACVTQDDDKESQLHYIAMYSLRTGNVFMGLIPSATEEGDPDNIYLDGITELISEYTEKLTNDGRHHCVSTELHQIETAIYKYLCNEAKLVDADDMSEVCVYGTEFFPLLTNVARMFKNGKSSIAQLIAGGMQLEMSGLSGEPEFRSEFNWMCEVAEFDADMKGKFSNLKKILPDVQRVYQNIIDSFKLNASEDKTIRHYLETDIKIDPDDPSCYINPLMMLAFVSASYQYLWGKISPIKVAEGSKRYTSPVDYTNTKWID